MADGRSSAGVAFNAGPVMNGRVSRVGFSASTRAGFMEAFECGTEACSAGRAASGALDSELGYRGRSSTNAWVLWVHGLHVSDPMQAAHSRGTFGGPGRSEAGIS